MENTTTARIDVQKLQTLNDRLCQTLDALNQLRLTTHNYAPSYSATQTPVWNGIGYGYQQQPSIGFGPQFTGQPVAPAYTPSFFQAPQAFAPSFSQPWMQSSLPQNGGFFPQGFRQETPMSTPMTNGFTTPAQPSFGF